MATTPACPSREQLESLMRGAAALPDVEQISAHVETCRACEETLQSLHSDDSIADEVRAGAKKADRSVEPVVQALIEKMRRREHFHSVETLGDSGSLPPTSEADTQALSSSTAAALDLGFLASAQGADELGRLGRYRVLRVLGKGGMGMVFLGHDPDLDRPVALKVMLPHIAANESAKQRFLREARAAAKLKSDHIVTIYQVSEERGVPFLAMELLEGAPLDQLLSDGRRLSVPQILRIGREVARGLADAHARGLIHRDIKPGNIWLDGGHDDRAKILDFGLARAQDDIHVTQSGAIVGTPAYMAPEQGRGEKLDARADLFSLGCMLYRLCVGDIPFKAETTMGVLMAIATHEPLPPTNVNKQIPPALSELIMSLLEKDPAKRPASARDVIARLQEIEKAIAEVRGELLARSASDETAPLSPRGRGERGEGANIQDTPPPTPLPQGERGENARRTGRPIVLAVAASLLAGVIALAGAIFFWQTPDGRVVRIESNDPNIKIAFEGGEFKVTGAYKEPILLKPGKVGLKITRKGEKGDDFEFETDKLIVNKGDNIVLRIEVAEGKVQIVQDGKGVLDAKKLPPEKRTPPLAATAGRYALAFTGSEYVDLPTPPIAGLGEVCLEAWATPSKVGGTDHPAIFASEWQAALQTSPTGKWQFLASLNGDWHWVYSSENAVAGHRTHVAGVLRADGIYLFVDGKLAGHKALAKHRIGPAKNVAHIGKTWLGSVEQLRISSAARFDKEFQPQKRFEPDKDALALYRFDEGQGDKLTDSSGNGHHGKIVAAKWVNADGNPITPSANFVLDFEGKPATVEIPSLSFDEKQPITVECQVRLRKTDGALGRHILALVGDNQIAFIAGKFGFNGEEGILGNFIHAGKTYGCFEPLPNEPDRVHHLATVWNGKNHEVYVNGKRLLKAFPSRAKPAPIKLTYFGAPPSAALVHKSPTYFDGTLDEVRVSNVVRYAADFVPPSPHTRFSVDEKTTALYHFDEGKGEILYDSSGNGHHGKIVGAKWVKADGAPIVPPLAVQYALRFSPKDTKVDLPPELKLDDAADYTIEGFVNLTGNTGYLVTNGRVSLSTTIQPWLFNAPVDGRTFRLASPLTAKAYGDRRAHIAGVRAGNELRLFVDGRLVASQVVGAQTKPFLDRVPLPGPPFRIGPVDGTIDEVRISKVARYDKDFTPANRFESDADTLALYHFDEGEGDVVIDSSGNGHHGKIVGAKWVKAEGTPVFTRAARIALRFEANDSVQIPTLIVPTTDSMTLEAYVTPLVEKFGSGLPAIVEANGRFELGITGSKAKQAWAFFTHQDTQSTTLKDINERPVVVFGKRIHLAGVRSAENHRLYVNGVLVADSGKSLPSTNEKTLPFTIGGRTFVGMIEEVRVSKTARYTKNFTPQHRFEPDADTLALYHFDEGQGDKLTDASGNGHHGKIVGAKWVKEGTPITPPASYAVAFNDNARISVSYLKLPAQGDFTLESWVTPRENVDENQFRVIDFPGKTSLTANGSKWDFDVTFKNATKQQIQCPLTPGKRVHLAAVRAGEELILYVDGKMQARKNLAKGPLADADALVWLGSASGQGKGHLLGPVRISRIARYTNDKDTDFIPPERFEPDADTLAAFNFEEGAGRQLTDITANKLHGNILNAAWVKADGSEMEAPTNHALRFDADVQVNSLAMAKLPVDLQGALTMEATFIPSRRAKAAATMVPLGTTGHMLTLTRDLELRFAILQGENEANAVKEEIQGPKLNAGEAVQIAAVHDAVGRKILLFINGKLVSTKAVAARPVLRTLDRLGIGTFYNGVIDEVRISRSARYDKDYSPLKRFEPDADTLALYHLDEGQGDTLADSSGNEHHGNIAGAKWVNADGTPIVEQAPDLRDVKPFYEADFKKPIAGWLYEKRDYYDQGVKDGRYYIALEAGTSRSCFCPAEPVGDFVCEVVGRVAGSAGHTWAVEIQNLDTKRFLYFKLNGKQELTIHADEGNRNAFEALGPIRHDAIKAGEAFNTLRLVQRGDKIQVYVNGVAVAAPIVTNFVRPPATFGVLCFADATAPARAEFERLTIWRAER